MGLEASQIEQLNTDNALTAHRVSAKIDRGLVESNLRLTTALFPEESTAADGLGRAYEALMNGSGRFEDYDLLEYFVYTTGEGKEKRVVGGSGFYRLIAGSSESEEVLEKLRSNPPRSVSFLRNQNCKTRDFLWGGRLGIELDSARSPSVMPYILRHILSTAADIIQWHTLAPALLAFTRRENNQRVQKFYSQLGFEKTGGTLHFKGEPQDVFVLALNGKAEIHQRLSRLVQVDRRRTSRPPRAA